MTDQDVLSTAYRDVVAAVSDLDADEEWLPTGCAGWSVRDLVFHMRGDTGPGRARPAGGFPLFG
jgi:hypothetical protein